MRKIVALCTLITAIPLAACDSFGQAVTSHTNVLARAGGHELTVDQAAGLVAPHKQIPAEPDVVNAVANLWVDYVLLATAAAQDSSLKSVDMALLLRPYLDQAIVWKLREKVINVDTTLTDESLRADFEREQPGLQVRARHILLSLPADATPAQRDSVTRLAQELRTRAAGGEDFAALARQYSQDGSAAQGGDLGLFAKDQMVAPFEEAAFKLNVGEVSDIVETPFGLHILKVEERHLPDFEEVRDSYRQGAVQRREQEAEERYITDLTAPLSIALQDGAIQNAKEIAGNPGMQLRGRAASRALVRYEGGTFTASEFRDAARTWNSQMRGQLRAASDTDVQQVLESLTRNEILIEEAGRQGLKTSEAEADSLREQAQGQLRMAALAAGLTAIQPQEGETQHQAIERRVNGFLEAILNGQQNVVPLGPIAFSLRNQYGGEVFDRAVDPVIAKIEALRPTTPAPQSPGPAPMPPNPDTTGASN
jgi:hypothetical protein